MKLQGASGDESAQTWGDKLGDGFSLTLSAACWLTCLLVLAYQVITWLQWSVWQPMPIRLVWDWVMEGTRGDRWLQNPGNWFGAHKVVVGLLNLPLALAVGALGYAFFSDIETRRIARRYRQNSTSNSSTRSWF